MSMWTTTDATITEFFIGQYAIIDIIECIGGQAAVSNSLPIMIFYDHSSSIFNTVLTEEYSQLGHRL